MQSAYRDEHQTVKKLSKTTKKSSGWIRKQVFAPTLVARRVAVPRRVLLILDVSFLSRHWGVFVAFDVYSKRVVYECFVRTESVALYERVLTRLLLEGYTVVAVVVDGRRGIRELTSKAFRLPTQLCHFHQIQIGKRYLGQYPKQEAAQDLLQLYRSIGKISENQLAAYLLLWATEYELLLAAKTTHPSGRWSYTHRRLRSAFRSLLTALPYVYTYRTYPGLNIPTTTNSLDGGVFSPMKNMLRTHRGLTPAHENSLVLSFLRCYDRGE